MDIARIRYATRVIRRCFKYVLSAAEKRQVTMAQTQAWTIARMVRDLTATIDANLADYFLVMTADHPPGTGQYSKFTLKEEIITQHWSPEGTVPQYRYMRPKRLDELTREQAQQIEELVFDRDGNHISYKLRDRKDARTIMAKHLGMVHDKVIASQINVFASAAIDLSSVPEGLLEEIEKKLLTFAKPDLQAEYREINTD